MPRLAIVSITLLAACAISACQPDPAVQGQDATDTPAAGSEAVAGRTSPATVAPTPRPRQAVPPAPPLPEGTQVSYTCRDGSELTVTYTHVSAALRWSDGREATLSRTDVEPGAAGDRYVAGTLALRHDGAAMVLQDAGVMVECTESAATA